MLQRVVLLLRDLHLAGQWSVILTLKVALYRSHRPTCPRLPGPVFLQVMGAPLAPAPAGTAMVGLKGTVQGAPPGGGGSDPYVYDRFGRVLPLGYRRMGAEVYWAIRALKASSLEDYMSRICPGDKSSPCYLALFTMYRQCGLTLELGYQSGGFQEVCRPLAENESVELMLNHLGAQVHMLLHDDAAEALSQLL